MEFIKRIVIPPKGAWIVYPAFERHANLRHERGTRGEIAYIECNRWRHNLNALDRA